MDPEFIAGPITILFGSLVLLFSRHLMKAIRRGIERVYGKEVADIFTDSRREKWVGKFVGIAFIVIGVLSVIRAMSS